MPAGPPIRPVPGDRTPPHPDPYLLRTTLMNAASEQRPSDPGRGNDELSDLGAAVQLVKDYARQETLGPLRGWGRYIAFGSLGGFVLGLGLVVCAVGVLRLLQTETTAFDGPNTSILAYLITAAVCVVVIALAAWQVQRRNTLQRKDTN